MVCSIGSGKMTALPRLLDGGSVSQNVTGKGVLAALSTSYQKCSTYEEIGHQKLAAQYVRREIQEADEANLIDEEDMHIFGLRPMEDPLDLVCCNACKKPIKASHYAAHADLCKSLSLREEIIPELGGPAVNKKPPRKERKKSAQTKKGTSVRVLGKFQSVDSDNIAASDSLLDEKIQMTPSAEAKRNMHLNSTHKMNGSRVNFYDMHCTEHATKSSSKPLKRTAVENSSNPSTKNLCKTAAEVCPYVPAPLATKIYYSQRNHYLRSAISHMFFESSKEVSNNEVLQANAVPTQTSAPSNFYHEEVANEQVQRDGHYPHLSQTPDQIFAARSDCYVHKSGGLVPTMNTASQLPVDNALGRHFTSNSYSFAGKAGNGSVPVL